MEFVVVQAAVLTIKSNLFPVFPNQQTVLIVAAFAAALMH